MKQQDCDRLVSGADFLLKGPEQAAARRKRFLQANRCPKSGQAAHSLKMAFTLSRPRKLALELSLGATCEIFFLDSVLSSQEGPGKQV